MKAVLPILIAILLYFPAPQPAQAEITVRPFLIDASLVPRESTEETVRLTSSYPNRKSTIYATVNEITVGSDGEINEFVPPVMTDRTNSITSWISVTRGRIEVEAGESKDIPLTIATHPFAEPGEYHAFVGFVEASKRYIAEEIAVSGKADGVIVKVTIGDERKDSMRITSMTVDRFVTRDDEREIQITVENAGELTSAPEGELIFYDNQGREVAAVPVNTEKETLAPAEEKTFTALIPMDSDLGRFKANVTLAYGANQTANLYDTTSFFMLPMPYLVGLASLLFLLLVILMLLIRRSSVTEVYDDEIESVPMYVRDGHSPNPKEHDIDLTT